MNEPKINYKPFWVIAVLSVTLYFTHGLYHPYWIFALPIVLYMTFRDSSNFFLNEKNRDPCALGALATCLILILLSFHMGAPYFPLLTNHRDNPEFLLTMEVCYCLSAVPIFYLYKRSQQDPKADRLKFAFVSVLVLIGAALSLVIWISPHPMIDVWSMEEQATEAFLNLDNPYTYPYVNIYPPQLAAIFTPFGQKFSYLPGIFLWFSPWKLLGLDIRYSLVFCHLVIGTLIYLITSRSFPNKGFFRYFPALLYLLAPFAPFLIEQGWNDYVSALFVVIAFFGLTTQSPLPFYVAINSLLLAKQYNAVLFPFLIWMGANQFKTPLTQLILKSTVGAAAVYLTLLVIDAKGFLGSLYGFQNLIDSKGKTFFLERNQMDSFGIMGWLYRETGVTSSSLFMVLTAALCVHLAWQLKKAIHLPKVIENFGRIFFVFFAFAPVAFINYYWFVLIFFYLAFALPRPGVPDRGI